ncbi:MAG TPA: hypothetical protein K8U78_00115 [Aeriscardovia aeriphila]|uniref:DUF8094 domain-containing protein n=1 Tax=Aeriscardovia aeriphila TaxID=218139 RepID=A0A921FSR9_9BIFI|nr:hypothetical protein [Aeriscardovia aeriphila]
MSKAWKTGLTSVIALASMMSLAGCGQMSPSTTTTQVSTDVVSKPAVSLSKAKQIEKAIFDAIAAADEKKDPALLSPRVTGPELAIRTSQLNIEKQTNTNDAKMVIPHTIRQRVLPIATGWPRAIVTITTTTDDQQSERLLVMRQPNGQQNYSLWGLVRLFSGVKLPKFEIPSIGTRQGTMEDSGLLMTPREAVAAYASSLENPTGDMPKKFSDDQFRKSLADLVSSVDEGVKANKGEQHQIFTPDYNSLAVVRSADGGDLVIAAINSEWTRSAGEGRTSGPASDAEKALFGNQEATATIRVEYTNVVALYIPPAGSKATIQAVGAERQPISAEAVK